MKTKSIYVRIADIQRFTGAGRDAILSAARLHNHRIVGAAIWFRHGVSTDFVEEAWHIHTMNQRQTARRNRYETATLDSPPGKPEGHHCPEART